LICRKNDYSKSPGKKSIGGIVGGVVGALALMGLFLGLYLLHRRRRNRRLRQLHSSHQHLNGSKITLSDEAPQGGSGLTRAGTFNLGNVRFTEPSLDHLRQIDHPPSYEPPPPAIPSDEITELGTSHSSSRGGSENVASTRATSASTSTRRSVGERQTSM